VFSLGLQIYEIPMNALLAHIPYGFGAAENENGTYVFTSFDQDLHNLAWRIFAPCISDIKTAERYAFAGSSNYVFTGYPKMDEFFRIQRGQANLWKKLEEKSGNSGAKRIIYAPHHTIDHDIILLSTFRWNYREMLMLAKKYEKETVWVFRPHPHLKHKAIREGIFQDVGEWDAYIKEWESLSNAVYMEGGTYDDLFVDSDAMIFDSCSFMTEYLYTDHPALFLERPQQRFSEWGEKVREVLYTADGQDIGKIEAFIQKVVLSGEDEMKACRRELFERELDYVRMLGKDAAENVYNEMCGKLT
jgi:CDP-glycerol glycerophosphotransferase (TagB/SpsB family)